MNYLVRTTIVVFAILLGVSQLVVFGISQITHLFDFTIFALAGSFVAWPLGGYVTWRYMLKNAPSDPKHEVAYFWVKKFMIITSIAGSIATPWGFAANTLSLYLVDLPNPFAVLLINATAGFAWPIGLWMGWWTQVQNKPIHEKYAQVLFWAKRTIFILIILTVLPFSTYLGIPFQILIPFPFGMYVVYGVVVLILIGSVRFVFKNYRP